jgi:hypothetical protein
VGAVNEVNAQIEDIMAKNKKGNMVTVSKNGGDYQTITDAINYVKTQNVSKANRWVIMVYNGVYNEKITLVDGIDLIGQDTNNTTISYSGDTYRTCDSVFAACDCSINNFTIIQDATNTTSDLQNFCIHADDAGNNPNYVLRLTNCIAKTFGEWCHHAMGCGLGDGQKIIINNCSFYSDSKSALFIHNWHNGVPMRVEINNSTIGGCLIRDKVNNNSNYGLFLQDVGSNVYEELYVYNSLIYTSTSGGYSVCLQKHPDFTGARNTLFIRLIGCNFNNFIEDNDSGHIILDSDILVTTNGVSTDYGKPLGITSYNTNIPKMTLVGFDDSVHVQGVLIPYAGGYGYLRTKGIMNVQVDASTPINQFDFLSTKSNSYAKKGTVGFGNCFAIALESKGSGTGFIKALLIVPR